GEDVRAGGRGAPEAERAGEEVVEGTPGAPGCYQGVVVAGLRPAHGLSTVLRALPWAKLSQPFGLRRIPRLDPEGVGQHNPGQRRPTGTTPEVRPVPGDYRPDRF